MSVEDQFNAAVQIIRSLPKNGSFQPPYAMQLTFYSHFKQATEGPCKGQRPSFWDVVGRAKYDAWTGLGTLSKGEAMQKYVDEFVSTIRQLQKNATPEEVKEALSYAEPKHIALFRPLFGQTTDYDVANLPRELLANGKADSRHSEDDIEKIEGNEDSDGEEYSDTFNHIDEDHSPERAEIVTDRSVLYHNLKNNNNNYRKDDKNLSYDNGNGHKIVKAGGGDSNSYPSPPYAPYIGSNREPFVPSGSWLAEGGAGVGPAGGAQAGAGGRHPSHSGASNRVQPVDNLSYAVVRLQYTMDEVVRRLDNLERTLQERRRAEKWSFFGGLQPHILAAILGWPLLVQFILYLVQRRRLRVQLRLK